MAKAPKPPPEPITNLEAAQSGDHRRALEVLRDTLARTLDECDPPVRAQVAARYQLALDALAALGASAGRSKRDELAAKRRERAANRSATA